MLPTINIGPLAIQTPGLVLLIGLWVGLLRTERFARKLGLDPSRIYNLVLISLLAGLAAARLSYAAQNPGAFSSNLLGLLALTPNMLDPLGGIAVAILAGLIYGRRKNLPLWSTLDALTPAVAIFLIVLGLSHLASGKAYGAPADLPWSVTLWGANRHPSQIYEIFAASAAAALVWPRQNQVWANAPGARFLAFTAFTASFRIFLEAFRGDSTLILYSVRLPQVIGLLILAWSMWLFGRRLSSTASDPTSPGQKVGLDG